MKLAVISDIHEDAENLVKALRIIEKAGCDEIACLGDIAGFSTPFYKYHSTRNANLCIRLIRENARYIVAGNHDHYAVRKLPEHIPGVDVPANWYDLPFETRRNIAGGLLWLYEDNELSALLSDSSAEWLAGLPEMCIINAGNYHILLSHFLYPDITGMTTKFLTTSADFEAHLSLMNSHKTHLALFGHTHQAGLFIVRRGNGQPEVTKKLKMSPSICGAGVPALASSNGFSGFAILDTEKNTLETINLKPKFKVLKG